MAKLTVLTDHSGTIIGTFQEGKPSAHAPSFVRIRPRDGQFCHELDVTDKLAAVDSVHLLHSTHRVEVKGGVAKLVEHKG
jgi:hypothetical protein